MTRLRAQDLVEVTESLLGPLQRQQRHATIVERLEVVRRNRERLVEAFERLRLPLEGVQHHPQIRQSVGRIGMAVKCARNETVRLRGLSTLKSQQPVQMQR